MAVKSLTYNPFWEFSLSLYDNQDVAQWCLALQDDWDADVNLMLYGIWLAYFGQRWDLEDVKALQSEFDQWRKATLLPIRTVRKRLRFQTKRRYYNFLKDLELRAEKYQQDRLWLRWLQRGEELQSPVDHALFAELLQNNLMVYLQRLEMRPRAQCMRPKVDDQFVQLIQAVKTQIHLLS